MNKLKVRTKLICSLRFVTAIAVIIGVVGIVFFNNVNAAAAYTEAIEMYGTPPEDAGRSAADLHAARAELYAAILFTGNVERVQAQRALVQGFLDDFEMRTDAYNPTIVSADSSALFYEAMDTYENQFLPAVEKTLADAESGVEQSVLLAYMVSDIKPAVELMINNISAIMTIEAGNPDTTDNVGADYIKLTDAVHSVADLHAVRAELYAAMLFTGNVERVQAQRALVQGFLDDFEMRAAAYDTIVSADSRALFDEAMTTYATLFSPAVKNVLADAESGVEQSALLAFMVSDIKPAVDLVINNISASMTIEAGNFGTTSAVGTATTNTALYITIIFAIIVGVAVFC